jgi:hypothetical protein
MLCREIGELKNEADRARRNQNEADDGHGEWTFIHKSRVTAQAVGCHYLNLRP